MSQIHILQTTCFSPKKLGCKLPNPAHFSCLQDGHRVPAPAKPEGGDDGAQPLQVGQGGEGQPAAQPPPVGQDGTQSDSQLQPTELAGPQDQCHSQTAKPTHEKAPEGPPHKDPPHEHPPQEVLSDEDPETEQPVQPMQPLREDVIYSSDVKTVMSTEVAEDLCDTKGGDKNGQSKSGKGKGSDCVATAMGDSVEAHLGGKSPGVPEVVEMQPPPLPEVVEMQPLPPLPPPQTPPPRLPPKPKLCLAGKGPAVLVPVPKMLMKDKGKTKARPGGVGNMHGSSVQPELEPDPQPAHPEAFTWETRKLRRTEQSSTKDEMEVVTVEDDEDGNYDEWAEWDEDEQTSAKWQQDKKVDEDVMEEEDQTWGAWKPNVPPQGVNVPPPPKAAPTSRWQNIISSQSAPVQAFLERLQHHAMEDSQDEGWQQDQDEDWQQKRDWWYHGKNNHYKYQSEEYEYESGYGGYNSRGYWKKESW